MNRLLDSLPLVAAVAIVGSGFYLLLQKAAPIVDERPTPPQQAARPTPHMQPYQPSSSIRQERPSETGAIYRCNSGGAVVYSDKSCEGGRTVNVQVTQGFESQRYPQRQSSSPVVYEPSPASRASAVAQKEEPSNAALCEQITKAIESIDAAARVGGTIEYMEDLKERRRKLVEKRQALRC